MSIMGFCSCLAHTQLLPKRLGDFAGCPFARLHSAVQVALAVQRSMLAAKVTAALDLALDACEGDVLSHLPERV